MWFFGHLGFTLAAAAVAEAALLRPKSSGDLATTERATALAGGSDSHGQGFVKRWVTGGPARLGQGFDYRLVAISSLLPDVDKPISLLLLGTFDRGYLHTALAGFLLIAAAVWLFRAGDTRLLQVAFGWSLHMGLDQVWRDPHLFLWPFSGGGPTGSHLTVVAVADYMERSLTTDPYQYVPEVIGAILVLFFLARIIRGGLRGFLQTGRMDRP